MGASGWEYVVPYQEDAAAALEALRRQVFADGDYVSPVGWGLAAPSSVDDLMTEPYWEFMGTCGTHSIIDVVRVVPAHDTGQEYGTIRPLTDGEYRELFGAAEPSRADFERARDDSVSLPLYDYVIPGRWTGRSAVLWAEGKPTEIAFWGYSGD